MSHDPRPQVPPEVAAVLVRLRRSIRRYVFLEGTALVLVVLGLLFWLSLGLDAAWFQLNRLELPRWFRLAFLVAGTGFVAAAFLLWIALRMFRSFRMKALALVLERRFPEFDDRLITAVELADSTTGRESELTRAMLARTVRQAADEARDIDVGAVFERRPLRRAAIAAVVLVAGIGAFAATNAHAMNRWWLAYFALAGEYWEREYQLELRTVTQPDQRVRRLEPANPYLHPKGGAFVPLIVVPDAKTRLRSIASRQKELRAETETLAQADPAGPEALDRLLFDQEALTDRLRSERADLRLPPEGLPEAARAVNAVATRDWPGALAAQQALAESLEALAALVEPWKVPDRVEFAYRIEGQRRTAPVMCTRVTDAEMLAEHQALAVFRHSLSELTADMSFSVFGGDFTNREPYEVRVVDPPRIVQPTLHCDFPPHAVPPSTAEKKWNSPGRPVAVHGGQIALPVETGFLFEGRCNKPLTAVRIEFGDRTIELHAEPQRGRRDSAEAPPTVGRIVREPRDGGPREVRDLTPQQAAQWLRVGSDTFLVPLILSEGATEPARERLRGELFDFGRPIVLPPGSKLRIYLTDADDILSFQPEILEIVGVADEPPQMIDIKLRGIGPMITRQAVVPVSGTITDDNGLAEAWFEFQVDEGQANRPRVFRRPPANFPREFQLSRADEEGFEQFDVLPLELKEGQILRLNLYAADGDLLNGPHVTRSERFAFQIVTPEELLAQLYGRELNLRLRFEQIIKEVETTRQRIADQRDANWPAVEALRAQDPPPADAEARVRALLQGIGAAADQSLHDVNKNLNETRDIELGFQDILEELINNRILTVERIQGSIVQPLRAINDEDFPRADRAIGLFRLANEREQGPTAAMNSSIDALDQLIQHMNEVLKEMQDLVEFHEAIQELSEIIAGEESLIEKARKEQARKLIEDFGAPADKKED
ncbi:MAG: hypothetical protein WD069_19220 [Planctomycetales bacterium]